MGWMLLYMFYELCPLSNSYADVLTLSTKNVIFFGDSIFTEQVKVK